LKVIYCTVFDSSYLIKALTLYNSLLRVNKNSEFVFFCIDDRSVVLLRGLSLERLHIVSHNEFLTSELESVRQERTRGEYCWTCKPIALMHLMERMAEADWFVYVDSDMMFFSDPDESLPKDSTDYLLTPHRFHSDFVKYERLSGKHNAGFFAVRPTPRGREVVNWWKAKCVNSCSAIPTEQRYADQKYLDEMLNLFPGGCSSDHVGLNAAPWNIDRYKIVRDDDQVTLNSTPLLLFHFQAFSLFRDGSISLYLGNKKISRVVREAIYNPYIHGLEYAFESVRSVDKSFNEGFVNLDFVRDRSIRGLLRFLRSKRNRAKFPSVIGRQYHSNS
jgi:hypothetical protein